MRSPTPTRPPTFTFASPPPPTPAEAMRSPPPLAARPPPPRGSHAAPPPHLTNTTIFPRRLDTTTPQKPCSAPSPSREHNQVPSPRRARPPPLHRENSNFGLYKHSRDLYFSIESLTGLSPQGAPQVLFQARFYTALSELPNNDYSWSTREYYGTGIRATRIKIALVQATTDCYIEIVLPVLQRTSLTLLLMVSIHLFVEQFVKDWTTSEFMSNYLSRNVTASFGFSDFDTNCCKEGPFHLLKRLKGRDRNSGHARFA
ncbi:hypothetical protein Fmac_019183 [Flemingia macrophylla]|uniref:Uncharacterized protein n=1 Tax=Flemingia macrophylla TaxID=520843 RepID=A0ABD1M717_9FABA